MDAGRRVGVSPGCVLLLRAAYSGRGARATCLLGDRWCGWIERARARVGYMFVSTTRVVEWRTDELGSKSAAWTPATREGHDARRPRPLLIAVFCTADDGGHGNLPVGGH
jgi:hypothetical protein